VDVVFLIGRILFVGIFLSSGVMGHLVERQGTIAYARAYGAPWPEVTVPLTGIVAIVGGLSVLLGAWADLGALLIIAFLVPVTAIMHRFWREQDPMQKQVQMAQFMKNVSMVGGALVIFYVFNQLQGDAGLCLTDPLFGRG
jgi:putative oxidoreductase